MTNTSLPSRAKRVSITSPDPPGDLDPSLKDLVQRYIALAMAMNHTIFPNATCTKSTSISYF